MRSMSGQLAKRAAPSLGTPAHAAPRAQATGASARDRSITRGVLSVWRLTCDFLE